MKSNRYLIDIKFKSNKKKYISQTLMAAVAVACILIFLHSLFDAAVLAAFGATCFIVFAMPHKNSSNNRAIIGGYLVGITSGLAMRGVLFLITPSFDVVWLVSTFGAIAIAISIFIMTITNTEHPPAAGVALGIALDGFQWIGVLILILAVLILLLIKRLLRRWLIDLV